VKLTLYLHLNLITVINVAFDWDANICMKIDHKRLYIFSVKCALCVCQYKNMTIEPAVYKHKNHNIKTIILPVVLYGRET
jgi:hypothetical protein